MKAVERREEITRGKNGERKESERPQNNEIGLGLISKCLIIFMKNRELCIKLILLM